MIMALDRTKVLPAKWDRFVNSSRVMRMKDYQRYWYWSLCMEAQFTDRPGYLPNDMRTLYKLAGCTASYKFFEQEFGCVRECFHVVKDDVRWLYQDTALEIAQSIKEKSEKMQMIRRSSDEEREVLLTSDFAVSIYNDYPRKVGRAKALAAIRNAIKRFQKQEKCSEIDAAQVIHSRVIEFAKSPAGKRGQYTPHPATWFNQDRYLDDPKEWYVTEEANGNNKQDDLFEQIRKARKVN